MKKAMVAPTGLVGLALSLMLFQNCGQRTSTDENSSVQAESIPFEAVDETPPGGALGLEHVRSYELDGKLLGGDNPYAAVGSSFYISSVRNIHVFDIRNPRLASRLPLPVVASSGYQFIEMGRVGDLVGASTGGSDIPDRTFLIDGRIATAARISEGNSTWEQQYYPAVSYVATNAISSGTSFSLKVVTQIPNTPQQSTTITGEGVDPVVIHRTAAYMAVSVLRGSGSAQRDYMLVYDMSQPMMPVLTASLELPHAPAPSMRLSNVTYVYRSMGDARGPYLFMNVPTATTVIDLSVLSSPRVVASLTDFRVMRFQYFREYVIGTPSQGASSDRFVVKVMKFKW